MQTLLKALYWNIYIENSNVRNRWHLLLYSKKYPFFVKELFMTSV